MPLPPMLDKGYAIATLIVMFADHERGALACDENILFIVHRDALSGEDGNGSVIGRLAHTHERVGEILESVNFSGTF